MRRRRFGGDAAFATALAAGVLAMAGPVRAEEPETIGIAVAVKVNVSDIEARILSDSLGKALAETFEIAVVAGEDADSKLPAEGLPEACVAEPACLERTAEALGADRLLVLVAVRVGDQIQVDVTLYDAGKGTSESRPPVEMTDRERGWRVAFGEAAEQLLPGAQRRKAEIGPGTPEDPLPEVEPPGDGIAAGPVRDAPASSRRWSRIGLFAGIAAAAATGTALLWSKADSVNEECLASAEVCPSSDWLRYSIPGDVLAGVAVGGLGMAIYYLVRPEDRAATEDTQTLRVGAGPGDVGLAVGGRF